MLQKLLKVTDANRNGKVKPVYQFTAVIDSKFAWYFLKAEPLKVPLLEKAIADGHGADLEHFGAILASGWGENPPAAVRRRFESR